VCSLVAEWVQLFVVHRSAHLHLLFKHWISIRRTVFPETFGQFGKFLLKYQRFLVLRVNHPAFCYPLIQASNNPSFPWVAKLWVLTPSIFSRQTCITVTQRANESYVCVFFICIQLTFVAQGTGILVYSQEKTNTEEIKIISKKETKQTKLFCTMIEHKLHVFVNRIYVIYSLTQHLLCKHN